MGGDKGKVNSFGTTYNRFRRAICSGDFGAPSFLGNKVVCRVFPSEFCYDNARGGTIPRNEVVHG